MATLNPIRVTEQAHELAAAVLQPGDIAIDATAGKGRDTAFLAKIVSSTGQVHAFDVQAEAIQSTQNLLEVAGLSSQVVLHHRSHAEIKAAIPKELWGQVSVVIFNCGYLPGSNQKITTQSGSTAAALEAAYEILKPTGRIVCVAYTGHPGGQEESSLIHLFADRCQARGDWVEKINYHPNFARPWILVVTRNPNHATTKLSN